MSRRRSSLGLLVASLLLSAIPVSSLAQSPGPGIDGIEWRLSQLAGSGVPFIDVPADVAASMRIDGAKAGGAGGCNQWFADVVVDGATVQFGDIGSTLMACGEPAMSIESAWLGYLPQVSAWSITDGRLALSDPNGSVMATFTQASPPSSTTTVSLGLYSGRPDPSWTLTAAQSVELGRLIDSLPSAVGEPPQGGLGYHGFSIDAADAGGADRMLVAYRGAIATPGLGSRRYRQDAARTVERYLLDTGRPYLSAGEIDAVETDLSTS